MDKAVEAALSAMARPRLHVAHRASDEHLGMEIAITAADAARAVTDEEVAKVLRVFFAHYLGAMPDAVAKEAVDALHAAGFKVIRK